MSRDEISVIAFFFSMLLIIALFLILHSLSRNMCKYNYIYHTYYNNIENQGKFKYCLKQYFYCCIKRLFCLCNLNDPRLVNMVHHNYYYQHSRPNGEIEYINEVHVI